MDGPILVALIALIGTALGAIATVVVAFITNRREKQGTAENTMEKTLRERILLRDEQLTLARQQLADAIGEARRQRERAEKYKTLAESLMGVSRDD